MLPARRRPELPQPPGAVAIGEHRIALPVCPSLPAGHPASPRRPGALVAGPARHCPPP
ncbi:hypothetical protein FRAAL0007 [Frankia alni ACN14a]|uniref:Uncharacterized protein n=1 Tax=Frankia alni (strain DSM 45986 / CECT 9034 / ACN14a) TaxID=326424 RepID=Q0RUP3_FRAAA|nr:hypothetical protein FRAAL0007 [Frankia alni ACN14a]